MNRTLGPGITENFCVAQPHIVTRAMLAWFVVHVIHVVLLCVLSVVDICVQ